MDAEDEALFCSLTKAELAMFEELLKYPNSETWVDFVMGVVERFPDVDAFKTVVSMTRLRDFLRGKT